MLSGGEFSPDGKWVAYAAREDRGTSLIPFIQPYPATGAKYQLSSAREGGHSPVWSADGQELFVTPGPARSLSTIKITTKPSFAFGPGELFPRPFSAMLPQYGRQFDIAGPGLRVLGLIAPGAGDASTLPDDEILVVLNWVEELEARVK